MLELVGGQAALAKSLGISDQAVSKWLKKGIPSDRILDVCRISNWQITPYELNPRLYPDPNWLPPEAASR